MTGFAAQGEGPSAFLIDAELYADIEAVSISMSEVLDDLWEGGSPDPVIIDDATSSEIQAALHLTRRSADIQVDLAFQLCERLPGVWEALHAGLIDLPRARILSDLTLPLPEELAREVTETALVRAPSSHDRSAASSSAATDHFG